MEKGKTTPIVFVCLLAGMFLLSAVFLLPGPVTADHKLADSNCYDCHAVGGASDMVVSGTRLIKKDSRIVEILNGGWTTGNPLPCVFCHDDDTVRTNMAGVKNHFTGYAISKHPVDLFTPSDGGPGFDCLECHTNIEYVGAGSNPGNALNPNIHGTDTQAVGWTGAGLLDVSGTYKPSLAGTLSPDNATGNLLCRACHDSTWDDPPDNKPFLYPVTQWAHSYTSTSIVSLEGPSAFTTTIPGCLSLDGSATGCHGIHNSQSNTDLLTIQKAGGQNVTKDDCGICHVYDDPPSDRANSDFNLHGHGRFEATNNIDCDSCHDSNIPHFNADGSPTGNRLAFNEDPQASGLSSPPKSQTSNCTSSNCHVGKTPHVGNNNVVVGCLDCHDPHGYGVGANLSMVRKSIPVAAPASSVYFEAQGAFFNSAYMGSASFSNWMCDTEDCHSTGNNGPGTIGLLMNPAGGTHSGGTGYTGGCDSCHSHDDANGSFRASESCTTCHGQPPIQNYGGGPEGFAVGYPGTSHYKAENLTPHSVHALSNPSGYGFDCSACHVHVADSTYHNTSASNPETFRNVVFDTGLNPNALAEGPNKYSPSYSIGAGTPNVCLNLYCHSDGQGTDRYNTAVVPDQAWDANAGTTLSCEGCHGSNRPDALGSSFFGAPDYANGGTGDGTYNPGSGVLSSDSKANSHLDTTKHGRYNCSVCHYGTTTDTNPADGWVISSLSNHVDGQIDVQFDPGMGAASFDTATKTCSAVWCHSTASPQWGATTTCTSCHNNGLDSGNLADAAPTSGAHQPHIANTVYVSSCESCHGTGANTGDQIGHVDQSATFGSQVSAYDNTFGTCANACHTVVDGRDWASATALECLDCHGGGGTLDRNGFPPSTGAHASHSADAGTADLSECIACHGDNGDNYSSSAGRHVDSALDVLGTGIAYTASTTSCTTTVCHSAAPNSTSWADTGFAWGDTAATSMDCDECHYWEAGPTAAANGADANSLSGDHGAHFGPGGIVVCADCHNLTIPAVDDSHINARAGTTDADVLVNMANAAQNEAAITAAARGSYAETDGGAGNQTCDNSLCHDPSDPSGTYEATWNTSTASCSLCHADTAGDPLSGSHAPHLAATATYGRSIGCSDCHTVPGATGHRNAVVDFAFADTGYTGPAAAPFGTPYGTCNTAQCHNDGTGTAVTTSAWGTTIADPNCGICHSDSPATASHGPHLASTTNFGIAIDCDRCHTLADTASHINEVVTMAADAAGYTGDTTVGGITYGTCGTNNCHNNGKNAPTYNAGAASYTWGAVLDDCTTCHGTAATDSNATEAHPEHLAHPTVVCGDCHTAQTSATHINQSVNVAAGAASYDGDLAVTGTTYGSCDTGACHDVSGTNILWNDAPVNCDQCHYDSTDLNSFDGQDKSASEVGSGEYGAVGHGAQAIACLDCHSLTSAGHDFTAALDGSANPFRLDTAGGFTCSDTSAGCHAASPAADVQTHSSQVMTATGYSTRATWTFTPECLNCHDPHGDGSNLSMIQAQLYDKAAFNPTGAPPSEPTEQTGLVFTDNLTGISSTQEGYADHTGFDSICQECHEGPNTAVGFVDDTSANYSGHPGYTSATSDNPGDCSECHKHDSGFTPSGCSGCHGGGTVGADAGNYWPDGSTARAENSPETGRHLVHVTQLAARVYSENIAQLLTNNGNGNSDIKQKVLCAYCHEDPQGTNFSGGLHLNTVRDVTGYLHPLWQAYSTDFASADGDAVYNTGADTCSAVDCHNNKLTTDNTYGWYDAGTTACILCHTDVTSGATATGLTHVNHTSADVTFGRTIGCSDCHDAATAWGDPGTKPAANHLSGAFTVSGSATFTYSGYTYPATPGTCGTNECHNDGRNGPPRTSSYAWGDTIVPNCTECHGDDAVSMTTSSHNEHLNAAGTFGIDTISCSDCHGAETAATHLNGGVTMAAEAAAYDGDTTVPGSTFGTCGTNACHNAGDGVTAPVNSSYTWSEALADCAICHAATPGSDQHPTHLSAVYGPNLGSCTDCHDSETLSSHIAGSVTFTDTNVLAATTACDTCHNGSVPSARTYWPQASGQWLAAGSYCEHCHDLTPSTIGVAAPNVEGRASSGYGAAITGHGTPGTDKACTVCHDAAKPHIDGVNGSSMSATDLRLQDTINSVDVSGATVVEQVCQACHQNPGGDAGSQVATHGNTNATFFTSTNNTHDPNAEPFAFRCDACHEPHGLTMNANGNPNIAMLKGSVEVMNYSVPGSGSDDTSLIPMVFEARTGTDSFDDGATQGNNVCVQCHQNSPRPGSSTAMASVDGDHAGLDAYSNNEQGNNCVSCHQHDYDADVSTVDGFMPLQCDGCHGYPPASNAHTIHVASLPTGYGYNCNECHSGNTHNESGILDLASYSAASLTVSNNIDIGFDATNGSGTYAPAKGSRLTAGSGTCSVLYCHGNESAGDQSDWAGSDEAPAWNSGAKACGSCHADPPSSGAHGLHTDVGGDTGRDDCNLCHAGASSYTTPTASHVNETTNVGVGYAGETGPAAADGYCTAACHDSGVGDDQWNDGELDCDACHYWEPSPSDTANTGHPSTITELSHNGHLDTVNAHSFVCVDCHADNAGDGSGATAGVTLSHINDRTGANDGARLTDMAGAVQDEATIAVTGWMASGSFNDTTNTCSNSCHDPAGTDYAGSGVWGSTNAGCTMCHEGTSGVPATGSHAAHVAPSVANTFGITIVCSDCHGADPASPGHLQGTVDFVLAGTGYNGSAGTPYGTAYSTCTTTDCHQDGAGTAVDSPTWGTASAGECATCHSATPVTDQHPTHLSAVYGPNLGSCTDCHDSETLSSHIAGSVTFTDTNVLAATAACDTCHNGSVATARLYWPQTPGQWLTDGGYCDHCHDATGSVIQGVTAPNVIGDGTNWGANVNGHSRPGGNYVSTIPAADRPCTECHDATKPHIDGVNGSAFTDTDLRFADTVNGISLAGATQVQEMCSACHQQTGSGSGSSRRVSNHGNDNASFTATTNHDANAETFTYRCNACHEPHGLTANGRTGTSANIYMVKPVVEIQNHSVPASTNETTTVPVILESRTGTDSFDDGATQNNNMCVVCHVSGSRPGSTTDLTNPNGDGTHANLDNYTQNEQGNNCTACHPHNYDSDAVTTQDGFMPQQCNACHSYPGLTTTGADHILSASHEMHAGSMGQGASGNYGFPCETCHYNFVHNETLYADGGSWPSTTAASNVNVRFDPFYNPVNLNGPSYAGVGATIGSGASGNGGTGACAGLNCHGNDAANQSDWAGSDVTPAWNSTAKSCGSCHADPPGSGAHGLHTNVGSDTGRDDCALCHSSVGSYASIDADHINGTPGAADVTGVGYAGQTGPAADGYCTAACHDSGIADDLWNDTELDCDACHYWETSPSDTANTAHPSTISELSHNGHLDTANSHAFVCVDCHADNSGDGGGATGGVTLSHISDRTGATDAARLTEMAAAVQDEAAIDTTGIWIGAGDWNDTNNTCANACHNPSGTAYVSAPWGNAMAGCTSCHSNSNPATGSHAAHMLAQPTYGKAMGCGDCHTSNSGNDKHLQGTVNFALSGTGYNGSPAGLPYGAPWSTCTTSTCHNDGTGTAVTTPAWGVTVANPSCDLCHEQTPTTDQHPTHLSAVYGPTIGSDCGACHDANANNTSMTSRTSHIDGTVDFADGSTLSATTDCDACHSSADADTARGYWPQGSGQWLTDGGYCQHCHDATPSSIGISAPNVDGRASSNYGASITGHNRTGSVYPETNNSPAGASCTTCHDATKPHIDGVNGSSTSATDLRLAANINGQSVFGVVEQVCFACHQNPGGSTINVANHGNVNGTFIGTTTHDSQAEQFAYRCDACHEAHGLTMNTNGSPNIAMLKGSVEVMNYSTPGAGSNDTELISMVFEARTGANSFDDGATQGNNVCVQCHQNNPRPNGTSSTMANVDGNHAENDDYANNEQGNNCTSCHQHDYDANAATADGFMPLQCDGCHLYPPTSNVHPAHVGSYSFGCSECHNGNLHNEAGVTSAAQYSATAPSIYQVIDVLFDSTNPNGSYPAKGAGRTAPGSGTCTGLYCHGDDWTVSAGGTDTTPAWNDTTTGSCGDCHSVTDPGSGSHTAHNTPSLSGTFGLTIACGDCHTAGTPASGTHVVDARPTFTGEAAAYNGTVTDRDQTAGPGTCGTNACHNDGTDNVPATAYTWGTAYANCSLCHTAAPATNAHNEHLAHPTYACTDCHTAETVSTHINGLVTLAGGLTYTGGSLAVGDGGLYGNCSAGGCHDVGTDIDWDVAATDCDECHYDSGDINNFDGQDLTASEINDSQWGNSGHGAQGVFCLDCHSMGIAHDFSSALDSSGNPFRMDTSGGGFTCSDTSAGCHDTAPANAVVNHAAAAITAAGGSVKYTWSFDPECLNCHDPHGDASWFMVQTQLYGDETATFNPVGTPPAEPTEQTGLSFADTTTGMSGAGDSYADSGSPFSSLCQECHNQTSGFVDDTSANYAGHAGFPGNPGDCGGCHTHDTGFTAGCAGCHDYPPASGAHTAHGGTAGGKPEFDCETCHGPGPGSAAWHNESSSSTYDSNNATHYNNVTFSHNLTALQRGSEDAYFNTTWTRNGASVAPTVTRAGGYAFECTNVYCHGLDTVTWTWDAAATGNPANLEAFRTCGGCHGVATDIDGDSAIDPDHDGDGLIDVASFSSRTGTRYVATNAAANYEGPISGFSRGGHGDTFINDAQWFEDTADGTALPVSCTACHDGSKAHFPVAAADPYRMSAAALGNTLPGRDTNQTNITNLCTQSNCHPKTQTTTSTGTYAFLEAPKHPSDYYNHPVYGNTVIVVNNSLAPINLSGGSSTTSPRYDPVGVVSNGNPDVQHHIDRYVDHWEWKNPSAPATGTGSDDVPFLPEGDSLGKQAGDDYNNNTSTRVTCITCHNPHGTDLHVVGQTPGSGSTVGIIPANRMLRLRDQDSELCNACH